MDPSIVDKFSPPANISVEAGEQAVGPLINLAHILIGFIGVVGFLVLIFAAYTYVTSMGEDDKIIYAKKRFAGAIAAIGVALLGEIITQYLLGTW